MLYIMYEYHFSSIYISFYEVLSILTLLSSMREIINSTLRLYYYLAKVRINSCKFSLFS